MSIYLVVASDVDGNNRDQLVFAKTPEDAAELWRSFMVNDLRDLHEDGASDDEILKGDFEGESLKVFEIPINGHPDGVVPWGDPVLEDVVV